LKDNKVLPSSLYPFAAKQPRPRLGMFVYLDGRDPDEAFRGVTKLGFSCCEIYLNEFPFDAFIH
jgi:hypothetical protein